MAYVHIKDIHIVLATSINQGTFDYLSNSTTKGVFIIKTKSSIFLIFENQY
jgi:hypothetical protein